MSFIPHDLWQSLKISGMSVALTMEQTHVATKETCRRKLENLIARIDDLDAKVNHIIFRLKNSLHCTKPKDESKTVKP